MQLQQSFVPTTKYPLPRPQGFITVPMVKTENKRDKLRSNLMLCAHCVTLPSIQYSRQCYVYRLSQSIFSTFAERGLDMKYRDIHLLFPLKKESGISIFNILAQFLTHYQHFCKKKKKKVMRHPKVRREGTRNNFFFLCGLVLRRHELS